MIEDPGAAAVLIDPGQRRYLEPFLRAEHTLQEAADTLGIAPSTMAYQIAKLRGLGLVRLVRTEPRKGMASKVYRANATRFFVPFASTSAASIEELLFGLEIETLRTLVRRSVEARAASEGRWGLAIALSSDDKIQIDFLPERTDPAADVALLLGDAAPPVVNNYLTVRLTPARQKELQRQLFALTQRVRADDDPEQPPCLLHLALVPLEDAER